MAEPTSLNLTALQAVVTWIGTDGKTNHLYRRDNDPTLQVTLDVKYNGVQGQSGCTGLFRLCVPVDLKASPHEKTPLFLYIRPERVASLLCQQSDDHELPGAQIDGVDVLVRAKLGPRPISLSFVLNNPADMVVPSGVALVPTKQRPHGEQKDSLMRLAQITSFSIFLRAQDFDSLSLLRDLADTITDLARSVESDSEVDCIPSLYSGQGGKILNGAELFASGPRAVPPLPPPYDDVGAPPPMAPLDKEHVAGPSTSSKSRKRRRDSDMDEASSGPGVENMVGDMYRRLREEMNTLRQAREGDRAFLMAEIQKVRAEVQTVRATIQTVKSDIMAEIQNKKTEVDGCTEDLDYRLYDVEKEIETTNDRIEVQVDDAVTSYKFEVEDEKEAFKSEMREFVTEQLDEVQENAAEEVEQRVIGRLGRARVSVEQASIRFD